MAVVRRRPGIGRVTRYCVPVASASGPTVLLNADWLTDTLLNASANPVSNGDPVDSWATATGGTFTNALAVTAGASQYPVYVAASGVHTAGGSAALTVATPITIPANADCDIYFYVNLSQYESTMIAAGLTAGTGYVFFIAGDTETDHAAQLWLTETDGLSRTLSGAITTGDYLIRFGRASNAWTCAATGVADAPMVENGMPTLGAAISIDTLLARSGTGSGLTNFSLTGGYIKKACIVTYPSGYSGRAAYRSALETTLSGSPLT